MAIIEYVGRPGEIRPARPGTAVAPAPTESVARTATAIGLARRPRTVLVGGGGARAAAAAHLTASRAEAAAAASAVAAGGDRRSGELR